MLLNKIKIPVARKILLLFVSLILISVVFVAVQKADAISYTDNAKIRIGLDFGATAPKEVTFTCSHGFMVVQYNEETHEYSPVFTTSETAVKIKNTAGKAVLFSQNGNTLYTGSDTLYIRGNNDSLTYNSRIYLEVLKIQCEGGLLKVINFLTLENYIKGVLPREIYPSWPEESLKTAAVVARSFALSSLSGKHNSNGFDVCPTTCCQVFGGNGSNENERTNAAIDATKNIIIAYENTVALAVYTSSTGYHTESAAGAWGGSQSRYPYLCGVSVPFETPEEYPKGKWSLQVTSEELKNYLNEKYDGKLTGNIALINTEYGTTGYCRNIVITDTNGNTLSASTSGGVRDLLWKYVNSAKFTIIPHYYEEGATLSVLSGDGTIRKIAALPSGLPKVLRAGSDTAVPLYKRPIPVSFTIDGYGYGHGVGLSQFGAMTMAKNGSTYEEILSTYFPGTYLTTLSTLGMINALESEQQ